ncbi:MAG: GNAT family N-acetyltransferase [Candidatus Doudnabacteria bacterium RIFCSPHIGHO2_01_FULL_46_14]|uniref:GNAT family N-acetyltransferase n=1 Tax=Candidatus Doudnabacteria bacterium RIFCSPHIGHO2_01_FULL_46_14 TaxID=1817824 RepID=A0A1F5NM76_9BACT|nr:MAG: GNAT family N-acetyltransferase [Candidatus Doudnabacteria bacterium RIFCSPHIGHO2_01_FULL_46_14]
MATKIKVRPQKVSDAKSFFEILNNDNFRYFGARPKTIKEEIAFLKKNPRWRKQNFAYNFSILLGKELVGGCGIHINQHRLHIGEIGYFVDESYWGKGIATQAVSFLETLGFGKLKLKRIEILMEPKNKASEKVAVKNGYKKEGLMKKVVFSKRAKDYRDCYLYAKVK